MDFIWKKTWEFQEKASAEGLISSQIRGILKVHA